MSGVQVSGSRLWVAVNSIEEHALEKTRTSCRCVQPVCSHTTGLGLTFTSAHVLVRAHVDGPGFSTRRHKGPQQCEVRALTPTLAFSPMHVCVIARRLGSHTEHDMDISKAPPHLGAPFPSFDVRKPRFTKLAIIFTKG